MTGQEEGRPVAERCCDSGSGDSGELSRSDARPDVEDVSTMELSSMPLDPIYAWGIVLEPVEVMVEETSRFVAHLAQLRLERGEPFSDEELERRFLAFYERLVEEGTLRRLPDAPPEMGRRILGPRRWLEAQRIRMRRLTEHWQDDKGPTPEA